MAEPPTSSSGSPLHGLSGHPHPLAPTIIPADWPVQAADQIVDTIAKVRDKTTRPALVASRAIVYGLLGVFVATVTGVLAIVLSIRLYAVYAPGPVWPIYAFFSVVFSGSGLFLLHKANAPAKTVDATSPA